MSAIIIDGKAIALKTRLDAAEKAKRLSVMPTLAVVLVGENPASLSYVTGKEKALSEAGMGSRDIRLPADTTEDALLKLIADLNADATVHGILVQLPLPRHINEEHIIEAIDPKKDVDGFHPVNMGKLVLGEDCFIPCTPHGIVVLLKEIGIETKGKHAVIVGRSNIVGKPLLNLLIRKNINATVTLCHTGTQNLPSYTRQADILIAAAGSPGLISGDMIKEGAVVIDVGVNRVEDATAKKGFRLKGDVLFDEAVEKASYITPVPGGVGPMTIAMLLQNVVQAAIL
ncbi:MAG: bifunctional 5,10-methylene-tetrahydrofolate dehydrogenase/5,10-methylene-tetrahydrofolate cyclohydrolase [Spirochaetaceae bacterium]|jgi:methylenetetrahydrofolate dehydrogenase (NADP+)/methenyltetrahydrofolate cyclohydrolase|nr:bifunctional 5,10-methylene-tetrahydrofolate dehydrogenase/5,10-methylene-tetrahydrofolate cyclohydrolase [Spirochaetaceae bacterium]